MRPRTVSPLLLLLALLSAGGESFAFYKSESTLKVEPGMTREESNRKYFSDNPVIAHDGQKGKFFTDFLKDRVVLLSFFYTNCPTADGETEKLAEVRKALEDELGKEFFIFSLSVDPARDTPEAVRAHAAKYNPPKGWQFLTGKEASMRAITYKLGSVSPDPESHPRIYLLGNLRTGHWMKINQYAPTPSVVEGIRVLLSE